MNESAIILLAEDLENDVVLIRRAFQRAGFTNVINVVRDGEEAIDYLSGTAAYANPDDYLSGAEYVGSQDAESGRL